MQTEIENKESDIVLDLSGVTCPGPVLTAKRVSKDLKKGQTIMLISDCIGTRDDLNIWARRTHHTITRIEALGGNKYAYYIRKGDPMEADVMLDVTGARCPSPIIEASKLLQQMKSGEILKLISNCVSAPADVSVWVQATNHELLDIIRDPGGSYFFYIQKA